MRFVKELRDASPLDQVALAAEPGRPYEKVWVTSVHNGIFHVCRSLKDHIKEAFDAETGRCVNGNRFPYVVPMTEDIRRDIVMLELRETLARRRDDIDFLEDMLLNMRDYDKQNPRRGDDD